MALPVDADPRYGRFGLRTDCPACGAHLPVNGPAAAVSCADCGEEVGVPPSLLRSILDTFEEHWPAPPAADTVTVGDKTWRWTAQVAEAPSCPACAAALPVDGGAGPIGCPTCRATVPREPVPDALRAQIDTARWVIGGEADQSRAVPAAPVALACPSCGAGLSITSRHHRITPCDHCGSRVHLPDAVWRALHPPRKVEAWFVRFEGRGPAARRAQARAEAEERKRREAVEKAERDAEKAARKAEAEAKRQEREARAAAARAEADRQKAEQAAVEARRRAWIGYPVAALAGLLTVAALGAELFAAGFFVFGHTRWMRHVGVTPAMANLLEDGFVFATIGLFLAAWIVGVFGATRAAGTSFLGVLPWCAIMVALCLIPVLGPFVSLFFAVQHFRGLEPTTGADQSVPRLAAAPLGLLHLGIGPLAQLTYAALGQTALGGYLP